MRNSKAEKLSLAGYFSTSSAVLVDSSAANTGRGVIFSAPLFFRGAGGLRRTFEVHYFRLFVNRDRPAEYRDAGPVFWLFLVVTSVLVSERVPGVRSEWADRDFVSG